MLYNTDKITVTGLTCFDLDLILDCGQAFRWVKDDAGCWRGAAYGLPLTVTQRGDALTLFNTSREQFETVWKKYFDLDRDYAALCQRFAADGAMKKAMEAYPGIRVLNQEPWEALCSFIISQNNNIPRIKGIIGRLCENFGEELSEGLYSFPSPERLAPLTVDDLAVLRSGFRAKYILDGAKKVASGEIDLASLGNMDIESARNELIKIKGVGPKVAECTLLFGCGFSQAFPVDVWMKRVLAELYPQGLPECIIGDQGIAQQYLFHWRRSLE
ncbi:MAG: DNA-3-methyladenine glycosylase 2 family protein [Clostridiales bacterium]|nr:DNA-3-methyladenine glycosylase 2 family protein [Clostridiales bacterium]